jgi:hypothetical protein
MSNIGFLVQQEATWKAYVHPIPKPSSKPRPWQEPELRWADLAAEGNWSEAVVAYLKVNWRGRHCLWAVVNTLVAETRSATRSLAREAIKEALHSMMQLIRDRRVMRYKRRWVAALELPAELQPSGSEISCAIPERSRSASRWQHWVWRSVTFGRLRRKRLDEEGLRRWRQKLRIFGIFVHTSS